MLAAPTSLRRGVALMVVLVAVAVLMVMATVLAVTLTKDYDRILIAADGLFRIKTEIIGAPPSFYERIKVYPGRIHHLVEPITVSQVNSCNQLYKASPDVNNWQGPYHLVPFDPDLGYTLASGIVASDTTARTTFTNGALALAIVMRDVQLADAEALKAKIDGVGGDTIAFTPNGTNPVTVYYRMPITALC